MEINWGSMGSVLELPGKCRGFFASGRSLLQRGRDSLSGRERVRVALFGAQNAGKTVFLTALENYLRYLASDAPEGGGSGRRLPGADETYWTLARAEACPTGDWKPFNYGYSRARLTEVTDEQDGWPTPTADICCLRMELDLVQWRTVDGQEVRLAERHLALELLDIPGERVSDVGAMFRRDYAQWSADVCAYHFEKYGDARAFARYLEAVRGIFADEGSVAADAGALCARVVGAYRRFVACQVLNYSPFVTPSRFVLDGTGAGWRGAEGTAGDAELTEESVSRRLLVCDLAPLPTEVLFSEAGARVAKVFARRYRDYQRDMHIDHLVDWMSDVNQAWYLVDVLDVLQNGVGKYNGVRNQIGLVLRNFVAGGSVAGRFWQFLFRNRLDKVCAVATQIDRTAWERDGANLRRLTESLFRKMFDRLDCRRTVLTCAAVKSTVCTDGHELAGNFKRSRGDAKTTPENYWRNGALTPQEVPATWEFPEDAAYFWYFPEPRRFPADEERCPPHIGLDEVVSEMLVR